MKYIAQWRYYSNLCIAYDTGPLEKGTEVDLEPDAVAAFNRDSPGVLVAKKAKSKKPRRKVEKAVTRQVRKATTRAKKVEEPED
ncbi:MAG: hypothetical protein ACE5HE_15250 [Phycisphaerae bacterium]